MFASQTPLSVLEASTLQQGTLQRPPAVGVAPGGCGPGNEHAAQVGMRESPSDGFETGILRPFCGSVIVRRRFQAAHVKHSADRAARNSADSQHAVLETVYRGVGAQAAKHSASPCGGLDSATCRGHNDQRLGSALKCLFRRGPRGALPQIHRGEHMIGTAELRHAEKGNGEHHQDWKTKTIHEEREAGEHTAPENQDQQQEIQHRVGRAAASPLIDIAQFMQGALARNPVEDKKDEHYDHYEAMARMQHSGTVRCWLASITRTEARDEAAEESVVSGVAAGSGLRARAVFERANPDAAKYFADD